MNVDTSVFAVSSLSGCLFRVWLFDILPVNGDVILLDLLKVYCTLRERETLSCEGALLLFTPDAQRLQSHSSQYILKITTILCLRESFIFS